MTTFRCPICHVPFGQPDRTTAQPTRVRRVYSCTGADCSGGLVTYEHASGDKAIVDRHQLRRLLEDIEGMVRQARGVA